MNTDLGLILEEVFVSIGQSSDPVTIELQSIFSMALHASDTAFSKARTRKLIGNPLGKSNDPLGDQLSWEILLENISEITELYIDTNDGDYALSFGNTYVLNPILYSDLIKVRPDIKVYAYNKLAIALQEFNKNENIKSLPDEKEMQLIIIDEPEMHLHPNFKFLGGHPSVPTECIYCGTKINSKDIGYLISPHGDITVQCVCSNCNHSDKSQETNKPSN